MDDLTDRRNDVATRAGCEGRSSTKVSEGPTHKVLQPLRMCPSGAGLRESAMLNPSGLLPWAAVRRVQCSILCSLSRIRGTGILQVSRHEILEKPETDSIIAEQVSGWKGLASPAPKVFGSVPHNPKRWPATSGCPTDRT